MVEHGAPVTQLNGIDRREATRQAHGHRMIEAFVPVRPLDDGVPAQLPAAQVAEAAAH